MSNISDHPNVAIRKEIEMLRTQAEYLESEACLNAQAIMVLVEKYQALRDLMVRALALMAKSESLREFSKGSDPDRPNGSGAI